MAGDSQSQIVGAVRFPVPDGWTVQQQVMLQLPSADGDFAPNIVMLIRALPPGATIESVAEERAQMLERHLTGFTPAASAHGQLFAQPAVRMIYDWHNGAYALRQVLVMCALHGWLYELTFSDTTAHFDQTVAVFDGWLTQLAIAERTQHQQPPGRDLSELWPGHTKK